MRDGIINIYKEKGYTSHDVVAIVRGILKVKAGHTGTLDPDACGVLPICIGKATKLADTIMADIKGYRAVIKLGVVTDTEDGSGRILEIKPVRLEKEEIHNAIMSFEGEYWQTPPMYSAVKIKGQKLYDLARQGKSIERKKRLINIYKIEILQYLPDNMIEIEVLCSKGTYIRTLCADIGEKLGCGANMSSLLRVRSGFFNLNDAVKLSELKEAALNGQAGEYIIPIESVLSDYKHLHILPGGYKYLYNGNKISLAFVKEKQELEAGQKFLVFDGESKLIGIYTVILEDKGMLKPVTMF